MNTLKIFTIRSLKLNKKRTIVTIIGIILSVALICSVAGVFLSFRESIIEAEIKDAGKYHTMFKSADVSSIDIIKNNKKVESYYYTEGLGYAKYDSRYENAKPYLYIIGYNESALENSGLKLISGRLPQNSNEIVLTENVNMNSNTEYEIGNVLELSLFDLKEEFTFDANGNIINKTEETTDLYTKEYTIVGFAKRINYMIDSFHEKGISVITYIKEPTTDINIFVYYKNPKDANNEVEVLSKALVSSDMNKVFHNTELLRWQGVFGQETLYALYGIAGVVIAVIIFTSIFVIRNGFAISVLERNKEYGILASIGATKKQIKKNVLYEGFVIGLISIPLGIIGGIGAVFALIFLVNILLASNMNMDLLYVIPVPAIILSVLLGALTIYLSCYFIARKQSKISPIERVRNTEDIKRKKNKNKSPKIIKSLFGTGGVIAYKNMQRNKKKYRTTVISMIISVILFITMSSFINYMRKTSDMMYNAMDFNILVRASNDKVDLYEEADKIVGLLNGDKYSIVKSKFLVIDNKYINFDFATYFGYRPEEENKIALYAIGNDIYKEYVEKIGGDYETFKDKGILVDNQIARPNGKWIDGNIYNIKDAVQLKVDGEIFTLPIAKKTKEIAMPLAEDFTYSGYIVVSNEMLDKFGYDEANGYMVVDSKTPNKLEKQINELNSNLDIVNFADFRQEQKNIYLVLSIFLYGFTAIITIIGITNIINTLTTSINLRRKEFAMLKSVGTTSKEFKQIINLESIFLGTKVLMIGVPISLIITYIIYHFISKADSLMLTYDPNIISIILASTMVFLIVKIIMSYSIKRINKQNIVEVIRNDNI